MSEHGRVLAVNRVRLGSQLIGAHALGATSLAVDDGSDFDEFGGSLHVGDQTVTYAAAAHNDDDTATLTLSTGLAAAADDGDPVLLWDASRDVQASEVYAEVEIDGEAGGDPMSAIVAHHLIGDLPEGIRSLVGESVRIEEDGDDWIVVDVLGISETGGGPKWESDDQITLTAAHITAGTVTLPLTHRPLDESLLGWHHFGGTTYAGVNQTDYTLDADAQTCVFPLGAGAVAGDVIRVRYPYRRGLAPPPPPPPEPVFLGSSQVGNDSGTYSLPLPAGWQSGDLFVVAANLSDSVLASCADSRVQGVVRAGTNGTAVFWGHLTASSAPIVVTGEAWWGQTALTIHRNVTVSESSTGYVPARPIPAPQIAGAQAAVVAVMAWNGFAAGTGITEDAPQVYNLRRTYAYGKRIVGIFDWTADGVSTNPASAFRQNGSDAWLRAVTLRLEAS